MWCAKKTENSTQEQHTNQGMNSLYSMLNCRHSQSLPTPSWCFFAQYAFRTHRGLCPQAHVRCQCVTIVPHYHHITDLILHQFKKLAWLALESTLFATCVPQCILFVAPPSNSLLIQVKFSAHRTLAAFKSRQCHNLKLAMQVLNFFPIVLKF